MLSYFIQFSILQKDFIRKYWEAYGVIHLKNWLDILSMQLFKNPSGGMWLKEEPMKVSAWFWFYFL